MLETVKKKKLGLYIHIPFCMSKCGYCDFYSLPGLTEERMERYVKALMAHMKEYSIQTTGYVVDTVYFGGGTPSLLSVSQMKQLMKTIKSLFLVTKDCEVSMEVNPKTVTYESLKGYRKAGVNRLSIGVQSFDDKDLKTCERAHTARDAYETITMARKAKFDNISIDLIFGLPDQTLQNVVDNVHTAMQLEVDHVSLYGLKIEEGTPFWFNRHSLNLPDEETERSMYYTAVGLLNAGGINQYEISNFAKKGKRCRHNLRYWNGDEYIGFGPAAHSYFAGKRFSYKKDLNLYIDSFDEKKHPNRTLISEYIDIPYSSRVAEYVMLRFRLNAGINCAAFKKRFGRNFEDIYLSKMKPFLDSGHIVKTPKGYAFSSDGFYVSNYILARIVDFDLIIPGTNN